MGCGTHSMPEVQAQKQVVRRLLVEEVVPPATVDVLGNYDSSKAKKNGQNCDSLADFQLHLANIYDEKTSDKSSISICSHVSTISTSEATKKRLSAYSFDEVAEHTSTAYSREKWFLYGRKVYSLECFASSLYKRVNTYINIEHTNITDENYLCSELNNYFSPQKSYPEMNWYPVYNATYLGIKREDMAEALFEAQIGTLVEMPRDVYLSRQKEWIIKIRNDLEKQNLRPNGLDFLNQLYRWLANMPNVGYDTHVDKKHADLNKCEFPLPNQIKQDPTVLRNWAHDWEHFDTSLVGKSAWSTFPFFSWRGNDPQWFVDFISGREDKSLPAFNTKLDGEAAWDVVPSNVILRDITTPEQERIRKARKKWKKFYDKERMTRRRKQIADSFLKRHDKRLKPEDMITFVGWAERLEKHWKEFQKLFYEDKVPVE